MPTYEPKKEVRFAIVMYGGVSLAIYINGVAQELLRMVRSTAGDPVPGSTEEIYREIAESMGRARFAIDVITGTSAGGINGVFLAKALVLDKDLEAIKKLWVQEGDIGKLLNDKGSKMREFDLQDPPQSLLNSRRMYVKLYDALSGLDTGNAPTESRLIPDELDLFVTATDLHGLVLPIQLADKKVFERKYRASFHFEYRPDRKRNQFTRAYTPFLAFGARCTSSFPVAFEPMQLGDIDAVLEQRGVQPDTDAWNACCPGYDPGKLRGRPLADGGYLDNKPFTFAVDELMNRCSDLPSERKMLYIEPAPDDPELDSKATPKLDAVENAWAALSSLPRQETIREDLTRVLQRNVEIERLNKLMAAAEELDAENDDYEKLASGEWASMDRKSSAEKFGRAYLVYRNLRVSAVTDDIAAILYAHYSIDAASQTARALRAVLGAWRRATYEVATPESKDTLNLFLTEFDLSFRMRRLRHLKRAVDDSCQSPENAADMAKVASVLRDCHRKLRRLQPEPGDTASLGTRQDLDALLKSVADESMPMSEEQARKILAVWDPKALKSNLSARYLGAFTETHEAIKAALKAVQDPYIAKNLKRAYYGFENHDVLTFPILHNSGVGEPDVVDVIRVSPEDATALINEREEGRHKLRGTALGNFGGFLDEDWRRSDIMWGRLDGAERIISALLPGPANEARRTVLVTRAHEIIVREELDGLEHIRQAMAHGPLTPRQKLDIHDKTLKSEPEREVSAGWATRSTTIIGKMLESIAEERRVSKRPFVWVTRAGRLGWALVEVLSPQSLFDLFFRHFMKLAWFAAVFLTVIGVLMNTPWIGVSLMALLIAVNTGTALLRDWLGGGGVTLKLLKLLLILLLGVVFALGGMQVYRYIDHYRSFA